MGAVILRDGPPAPLLDTVAALWPHAEVRLVRRHAARRDTLAEFALAPSGAAPRLAIPVRPAVAAARSLRRASSATEPVEVATRLLASQVLRVGGVRLLGYRLEVTGSPRDSLADHLEQVLGQPVRFALGIGSARVNRKPVLELFDRDGRRLGFAKVGLGPVACESVLTEAAALPALRALDGSGIAVPRLIGCPEWRGAPVLVMSTVPAAGTVLGRDRRHVPTAWMRTFEHRFAEPARPLGELPWWGAVTARLARLSHGEDRETAVRCAEALLERAGDRPLPLSAWHGDWTPWNMARHAGGLSLWDWERFETGVPAGLDPIHYCVNLHTVAAGETPAAVAAGIAHAQGVLGLGRRTADLVAECYLAAINARYLPLAEGPGGAAIADRAIAFLTAWEQLSRRS